MQAVIISVIIDAMSGSCAKAIFSFAATAVARTYDIKVGLGGLVLNKLVRLSLLPLPP